MSEDETPNCLYNNMLQAEIKSEPQTFIVLTSVNRVKGQVWCSSMFILLSTNHTKRPKQAYFSVPEMSTVKNTRVRTGFRCFFLSNLNPFKSFIEPFEVACLVENSDIVSVSYLNHRHCARAQRFHHIINHCSDIHLYRPRCPARQSGV